MGKIDKYNKAEGDKHEERYLQWKLKQQGVLSAKAATEEQQKRGIDIVFTYETIGTTDVKSKHHNIFGKLFFDGGLFYRHPMNPNCEAQLVAFPVGEDGEYEEVTRVEYLSQFFKDGKSCLEFHRIFQSLQPKVLSEAFETKNTDHFTSVMMHKFKNPLQKCLREGCEILFDSAYYFEGIGWCKAGDQTADHLTLKIRYIRPEDALKIYEQLSQSLQKK